MECQKKEMQLADDEDFGSHCIGKLLYLDVMGIFENEIGWSRLYFDNAMKTFVLGKLSSLDVSEGYEMKLVKIILKAKLGDFLSGQSLPN